MSKPSAGCILDRVLPRPRKAVEWMVRLATPITQSVLKVCQFRVFPGKPVRAGPWAFSATPDF